MAGFHLYDVLVKFRDFGETLFSCGLCVFGIDESGFVALILRRKTQVFKQIPFFFEWIAACNVDILNLFFFGLLNESIEHSCVIEFVVNDFVDEFGEVFVAVHASAVFDEFVTGSRLTFAGI